MERTLVIDHSTLIIRRAAAVVVGALVVAAAAQVSVPLPGTPVPMTLQPLAVLLVGGLLGAPLGALSMILYLAMGAAGLPGFTPTVPLVGFARLLGPTGGDLLAYPDRKSTRLNSSHLVISYAVFCLEKKKKKSIMIEIRQQHAAQTP